MIYPRGSGYSGNMDFNPNKVLKALEKEPHHFVIDFLDILYVSEEEASIYVDNLFILRGKGYTFEERHKCWDVRYTLDRVQFLLEEKRTVSNIVKLIVLASPREVPQEFITDIIKLSVETLFYPPELVSPLQRLAEEMKKHLPTSANLKDYQYKLWSILCNKPVEEIMKSEKEFKAILLNEGINELLSKT